MASGVRQVGSTAVSDATEMYQADLQEPLGRELSMLCKHFDVPLIVRSCLRKYSLETRRLIALACSVADLKGIWHTCEIHDNLIISMCDQSRINKLWLTCNAVIEIQGSPEPTDEFVLF